MAVIKKKNTTLPFRKPMKHQQNDKRCYNWWPGETSHPFCVNQCQNAGPCPAARYFRNRRFASTIAQQGRAPRFRRGSFPGSLLSISQPIAVELWWVWTSCQWWEKKRIVGIAVWITIVSSLVSSCSTTVATRWRRRCGRCQSPAGAGLFSVIASSTFSYGFCCFPLFLPSLQHHHHLSSLIFDSQTTFFHLKMSNSLEQLKAAGTVSCFSYSDMLSKLRFNPSLTTVVIVTVPHHGICPSFSQLC